MYQLLFEDNYPQGKLPTNPKTNLNPNPNATLTLNRVVYLKDFINNLRTTISEEVKVGQMWDKY